MYYTIYKITNKDSGKFYIGSHKTDNLDDGYFGSGKLIKRAVASHGVDSFCKEIIFVFDNPDEMYAKEAEIVTNEFISENNVYNLMPGGFGGWDRINNNYELRVEKNRKAHAASFKTIKERYGVDNPYQIPAVKKKISERIRTDEERKKIGEKARARLIGTHLSEETKRKIGEKNKISQKGERNSRFGARFKWITNGSINKQLGLSDPMPEGYVTGITLAGVAQK